MNGNRRATSFLFLTALAAAQGCETWPTHAHLPVEPLDVVPPGTDPADAVDVAWAAPVREEDPGNGTPPEALTLGLGEGLVLYGSLQGAGWDPTQTPSHEVTCDSATATSEYPPLAQGAYSADEDWISLSPSADGQLCVVLEVELPAELGDELFYDMLLYELDPCMNPLSTVDDEEGEALGLGLYAASTSYGTNVTADEPLALLLAGVLAADSSDVQIPWRLGLALLESVEQGGSGVCPNLPEAP